MHKAEADLSPDPFDKLRAGERRREIATILAAGILRLSTRLEATPEPASSGAGNGTEETSDPAQKPLDLSAPPSPHVRAG